MICKNCETPMVKSFDIKNEALGEASNGFWCNRCHSETYEFMGTRVWMNQFSDAINNKLEAVW